MKKTYMPPIVEKIYVEKSHLLISTNQIDTGGIDDPYNEKIDNGGGNEDLEGAKKWGQLWDADWN